MTATTSDKVPSYHKVLDGLAELNCKISTRNGVKAQAQCPAHEDRAPSLSITHVGDKTLLYCHAGCDTDQVLAALHLDSSDLFDDHQKSWSYTDAAGNEQRKVWRDRGKRYRQSGNTGAQPILYAIPRILEHKAQGNPIYLVEGEKDADTLNHQGHCATTAPMGATNFSQVDATPLQDADVIAVQDNDDAGVKWARQVAETVGPIANSLTFKTARVGKDTTDHVAAGYSPDEFIPIKPPEPVNEPARRIRLTPASAIKPRPVRWAWTDRIPAGELTLTPGRGGVGKSTFHAWMIANLTQGTLPGVHFGTPKPCIIAASEDSWDRTIVPRLIAADAHMDLVYRVDVQTETDEVVSVSMPLDVDGLEAEVTRIGAALVSMDPVMSLLSNALDTHKDREVRTGLEPLGKLADHTGCVVLGNAHFNKSTGSDPLSLIMGSAAFGNVARAALGFARDTEDEDGTCVISQAKNNLGRLDLPSLRYRIDPATIDTEEGPAEVGKLVMLGETDRSVSDILRDHGSNDDDRTERDEAVAWLIDYLTSEGGSAKAGDAIKAAADHGIAKTTLTRARTRAKVKSVKSGMTGGWVWTTEESTEGTEEPRNQKVDSSDSSVDSSDDRYYLIDPETGETVWEDDVA